MTARILDNKDPKIREYLAKIGEVIVLLNHVEASIDFLIWELIGANGNAHDVQNVGRRVTLLLEYMQKVDLVRALIIERHGEEKGKEFVSLYKKLQTCGEIRNDIAHSQWFIQYGNLAENIPMSTTKINIKKAFERGKLMDFSNARKEVLLDELEGYVSQMNEIISELFGFFFKTLP
jgi:hypothetical protein